MADIQSSCDLEKGQTDLPIKHMTDHGYSNTENMKKFVQTLPIKFVPPLKSTFLNTFFNTVTLRMMSRSSALYLKKGLPKYDVMII